MTTSRSLLAIALTAAAPSAWSAAVSVDDEAFRLSLNADIETRAERASADDPAGGDYDVVLGRPGKSDAVDLSMRRVRFGTTGTYGPGYRFSVVMRADNVDAAGYQASRGVDLYKAWVERDLASGDLTSTLHLGLDQPFFNRSQTIEPYWLFPAQRASGALLAPRGVGLRYKLSGPAFDLGFDVMNNLDTGKPATNADKQDGLFYSARLELSVLDSKKPAYRESYAGDQGEGLLLCADVGYDDADYSVPGVRTRTLCYGVEGLGHFDEFSCLAEVRFQHVDQSSFNGSPTSSPSQRVVVLQAGWATQIDRGVALEPAIRLELIDLDTANDHEKPAYDTAANPDSEWGASGRQIDLGLNLYLARYTNKLQFSYSHWDAEDGDGKADIFRLQHTLFF